MGSERGAANLARFNKIRSSETVPNIMKELQYCRRKKLEFKSVGLLAAYIGEKIGIHRTTLLRNSEYRNVLMEHFLKRAGSVVSVPDSTQDVTVLQAKLAAAKLELSLLDESNKVAQARQKHKKEDAINVAVFNDVAFADLAAILSLIILRVTPMIKLNLKSKELVDIRSRPSERVIAGPDRMNAFCAWIECNKNLPHLQELLRVAIENS